MRYRKLGPSDDYTFGNGQQDFWRDVPEAVGQSVKTRLLLWLGEWYLNITEGTPYMQGVFGKHSVDVANTTIQDRALRTFGVTKLKNYLAERDPDTRNLSVEFDIDTIYGPTAVEIENYANY